MKKPYAVFRAVSQSFLRHLNFDGRDSDTTEAPSRKQDFLVLRCRIPSTVTVVSLSCLRGRSDEYEEGTVSLCPQMSANCHEIASIINSLASEGLPE